MWKTNLIDKELLSHEAKIIIGIPLSIQEIPNKQVWFVTTYGDYTTRIAYHLIARSERNKQPSCSTRDNSQLWKGIWNLQVPYKVKHLIWRVANESLPTLQNLLCRNMVRNAVCPTCKLAWEDTIHALWNCQRLWVIWDADDELKKCFKHKFTLFADLLEMIFLRKESVDVKLFAVIIGLIWICITQTSY